MSVGPFVLPLFLKSSWGADTWPLKLLIISSLSFLSASNSWNFSERKLTVSARSVSCFSTLIWFSFKVFVCSDISFTLDPSFLQQSRQDTSTAWRVQTLFKNLIIAVTSTWCCFFGYILFRSDTPIFATSSSELQFVKHGIKCDTEKEIMKLVWKVVKFHYRISESQQRSISPCGRCFAQLLLQE